jgi:hypothetical protein
MKYYYLYSSQNGDVIYHWFCDSDFKKIYYRSSISRNVLRLRENEITGDKVNYVHINELSLDNIEVDLHNTVYSVKNALKLATRKILNSI